MRKIDIVGILMIVGLIGWVVFSKASFIEFWSGFVGILRDAVAESFRVSS